MISEADDLVLVMLKMVMDIDPSFSAAQALQVEQQIRREWGGEQVKIAKRGPLLRCARKKVLAEIGIKSPHELQVEVGVSRSTLYRWISKKEKNKD